MAILYDERQTYILVGDTLSTLQNLIMFPQDTLYPNQNNESIYPEDVLILSNNIVQGTMDLDERIADGDFVLGKLYSSKFECDLYNVTTNLTGKFIHIYQTPWIDDEDEETEVDVFPIFFGYIDSCSGDRLGTDYHIIAYDLAYYYGKINIADWWNSYWETEFDAQTLGYNVNNLNFETMLKSALTYCGITFDFTFPIDGGDGDNNKMLFWVSQYRTTVGSITYWKSKYYHTELSTLYLSDLIESACQLSLVTPRFDRTGIFTILDILEIQHHTAPVIREYVYLDDNYDKGSLNLSETQASIYQSIKVGYASNWQNPVSAEYNYNFDDTIDTKTFEMSNNVLLYGLRPFLNNTTLDLVSGGPTAYGLIHKAQNIIDNLYVQLQYYLCSVDLLISHTDDILGKSASLSIDNETYVFPILHTEYKDCQLITQTVEATGTSPNESDTDNSISYSETLNNETLDSVASNVDTLQSDVEDIQTTLSADYQSITNKAIYNNTYTDILSMDLSAGTYQINGYCWFTSNQTGYRQLLITNTSQGSSGIRYGFNVGSDARQTGGTTLVISNVLELTSDTTIYLVGYQNGTSTSPYTLDVNATLSYMRIK